jgi:hypothetical protein
LTKNYESSRVVRPCLSDKTIRTKQACGQSDHIDIVVDTTSEIQNGYIGGVH